MSTEVNALVEVIRQKKATLVAVSKTRTAKEIKEVYDLGIRDFGENRVQELLSKHEDLPVDISWHLIGHLQSNKVKYVAPFVALIHSVDSSSLISSIDKEGRKNQRIVPVLLQIKIAREDTKFGLTPADAESILADYAHGAYPHVRIRGFMGMATFTEDMEQVRKEFIFLREFKDRMCESHPVFASDLTELSMGMSSDFEIALQEGATMVRIGTLVFGPRR